MQASWVGINDKVQHVPMTTTATKFNVLTTPWLEVIDLEANVKRMSVLDALRQADSIDQIVSPSPLDLFAAYRFLLTLLYWVSKQDSAGMREQLLKGVAPEAAADTLEAEVDVFNLFDEKQPFLQDPSLANNKKKLSAASLFTEMAAGTNVAHFHHSDDKTARLCLRCAALGLLRLVPWTQSGGSGKQPAIHGAPPMMTLAQGKTLCETLGLNLIPVSSKDPFGTPTWTGQFKPSSKTKSVPFMEALTWNPRRVHLGEFHEDGLCTQCGCTDEPTIGPIVFEKNPACKVEKSYTEGWKDPAAFYGSKGQTVKTTREESAAVGDDVRKMFKQHFGKKVEPAPESHNAQVNDKHDDWLVVMPCTNPANNKSFDHRSERIQQFDGKPRPRAKQWHDEQPWQTGDKRSFHTFAKYRPTPSPGAKAFTRVVMKLDTDSLNLIADTANKPLDDSPAAFDIFTSAYWPLRQKHTSMPSRQAAWLFLKLFATAGANAGDIGTHCPWSDIRDNASLDSNKPFPRAVPEPASLEHELRTAIRNALQGDSPKHINWPALCQFLTDTTL